MLLSAATVSHSNCPLPSRVVRLCSFRWPTVRGSFNWLLCTFVGLTPWPSHASFTSRTVCCSLAPTSLVCSAHIVYDCTAHAAHQLSSMERNSIHSPRAARPPPGAHTCGSGWCRPPSEKSYALTIIAERHSSIHVWRSCPSFSSPRACVVAWRAAVHLPLTPLTSTHLHSPPLTSAVVSGSVGLESASSLHSKLTRERSVSQYHNLHCSTELRCHSHVTPPVPCLWPARLLWTVARAV